MLVLVALLLALVPAVAILYPFVRRRGGATLEDESSPRAELARRWEGALAGLKSAELERAVGTLAEDDYLWLREQYMQEAAMVLKALELEEQEESEFLAQVQREVQQVRQRMATGPGSSSPDKGRAGEETDA